MGRRAAGGDSDARASQPEPKTGDDTDARASQTVPKTTLAAAAEARLAGVLLTQAVEEQHDTKLMAAAQAAPAPAGGHNPSGAQKHASPTHDVPAVYFRAANVPPQGPHRHPAPPPLPRSVSVVNCEATANTPG